ncbi:rhodanese-like domain-containing protein [Oceanobacillus kapialis]|uniref:Rhodanese-like domain-containing protein n=1 Tax=Oceanobacillus kapialis TaxID=481353 RepID=A0ABW5PZY7_9BACI
MAEIKEVSPQALRERLNNKEENLEVIDVREDEEVAQGIIPQAKHIPLQEVPDSLSELDQDKHYVMVCRSGRRSMRAATHLKEQGYDVSNMAGGMLEWEGDVEVKDK